MKTLNKYTYLFIGVLADSSSIVFLRLFQDLKNKHLIQREWKIYQKVLLLLQVFLIEANIEENETKPSKPEIIQIEKSEIEKLLINNNAKRD